MSIEITKTTILHTTYVQARDTATCVCGVASIETKTAKTTPSTLERVVWWAPANPEHLETCDNHLDRRRTSPQSRKPRASVVRLHHPSRRGLSPKCQKHTENRVGIITCVFYSLRHVDSLFFTFCSVLLLPSRQSRPTAFKSARRCHLPSCSPPWRDRGGGGGGGTRTIGLKKYI